MAPDRGRVAFVCAMPMEMAPLRRPLSLETRDRRPPQLHAGSLDGRPVAAVTTGMGPELARAGLERLLAAVDDVEWVVVVGITGAVGDATPVGMLVHPEQVVDGATGTADRPRPLARFRPAGTMWTTADLITDADRIAALRADDVVALDMETAAVGAVCDERGIPWSVVRAISDRDYDGSVDGELFAMSDRNGTPRAGAVLYLLRHPGRIPTLARMGRDVQQATRRAAALALEEVRGHWRTQEA
jgi:adenosylhomocysteine nucleosidase